MRLHRTAVLAGALGLAFAGGAFSPDTWARQNDSQQQDKHHEKGKSDKEEEK